MSTLFAPIRIKDKDSQKEYVAVGTVIFPFSHGIEVKTNRQGENPVVKGPHNIELANFLAYSKQTGEFKVIPLSRAEYIGFVDQCLMCGAPKGDKPEG